MKKYNLKSGLLFTTKLENEGRKIIQKIVTIFLVCLVTALFGVSYARADTWTTFDMPGATWTNPSDISGNNIIGYYSDTFRIHGFLYNGTSWTTLDMPGASHTFLQGIDGNNIVGAYNDASGTHGFLYNGATWTTLDRPGAMSTHPLGISGNSIVGIYDDTSGHNHSFLYNGTGWTTIDMPEATNTTILGIDGNNIIGYYQNASGTHGFLYNGTTWTTLDMPGARITYPGRIDGNNIVGIYYDSSGYLYNHGFLYNGTTWTTLDRPGAILTALSGIDGNNIVGYSGVHGFLYTMPSNQPPTLSYSQDPGYVDDGINPNDDDTNTNFTFKIVYTDADNDAPTNLRAVVYNGGTATSTLLMSTDTDVSVNPILRDGNYQNGEQYMAISTFPKGNYGYIFETSDINNGGQSVLFPNTVVPTFTVVDTSPIPIIIVPGIMGSRLFNFTDGEEVWPNASKMFLSLDDNYLDALKLNIDGSQIKEVHPTGIILEESVIGIVYYKNLVDSFTSAGYTLENNLFLRPYDWRLDINQELARLEHTVQQAISKSPNGKIDIIAHSLGGLLVKTYLNQLSDTSFVNKLVLIGSPQLGAPKVFKALNYGDNLGFSFLLNTDRVKEITQNMPGVYELLPSQRYIQINGGYVKDFRNNQPKVLDYEQTNQFMLEKDGDKRNPNLLDVAKNFHSSLDSSPINAPKIYNIVGCQNPETITGFRIYDNGKMDIQTSDGDGTVPLTSAMNLSGGYTANYFVNNNITGINHLGLVKDGRAVDLIKEIVTGETINLPNGFSTASSYCSLRPYDPTMFLASIHSPAVLHAYDSQNRHTGPLPNGDIELGISGSSYEKIGENSFAFVPAGDNYRFVADGLASGAFDMKVRTYHGNELTDTVTYLSVPLASDKTNAELNFTGNQSPPNLLLDSNGDGTFETAIQPTAILGETASADITPPKILINSPTNTNYTHNQTIPINISVADAESGVVLTEVMLDGIIFTGSTIDSFFEKLGDHQLAVHAVDRVGNPSNLTTTFRIIATTESTVSDIERAYTLGWIDNAGIKNSLVKKFQAVVKTKINKVLAKAFLNELEAQRNKHINEQAYQLIKEDIEWLLSH